MTAPKYVLVAKEQNLDLGILVGDQIIAERADTAEVGDQVIALIDGVASVRRFEPWMRVLGRVLEVARRVP